MDIMVWCNLIARSSHINYEQFFLVLQDMFASWIENAGFSSVTITDMTFGAVAIHSGFKL